MRLLLISCSDRKSNTPGVIPAIDRYQGSVYKVIKKARKESYWPKDTCIYIISAKYGLISENSLIELYDQKMTKSRAIELQSEVSRALDGLLRGGYSRVFVNLGEVYRLSVGSSDLLKQAYQDGVLQEASGEIGGRLQQTKAWIVEQHCLDGQ